MSVNENMSPPSGMNGSRQRIVIAMKIDCSGSLSFAIRGIPSPIRPLIRHSGEGRNPEGKGGTNHTQTLPTTKSHFHTLVCRRQPA